MGALGFEKRLLAGAVLWEYALGWLFVFTLVGFCEESLLRGYLQYRLAESTGFPEGRRLGFRLHLHCCIEVIRESLYFGSCRS
jgi:membrane protease YdiL (CAAX protease family)